MPGGGSSAGTPWPGRPSLIRARSPGSPSWPPPSSTAKPNPGSVDGHRHRHDTADGALPTCFEKRSTSSASLGQRSLGAMNTAELAAVRPRLEEFAVEMFAPLSRSDQRDKGLTYLRGLLLDGRRKSMQPMAERLGVDHQGLQQFVSSSTWAVEPVRARLARRAIEVIAPDAWVVDDTGFPKDGA